ncbi:phosphopantetheine-binding protein, partial [Planktothrix sp.]|uniref:phosphopantetheine-binding protein n=1 Tax=Planktothrix sp. TaxID=3088171 RepID=UPI0038D376EA
RALEAHPEALFVEVGPGRALAGLVRRLGGEAVSVDDPRGPAAAAAALLAAGHPGFLASLPANLAEVAVLGAAAPAGPPRAPRGTLPALAPEPASPGDARAAVLEVVAEVTGYPPEELREDAELEADLGIDSIRNV